MQNCPHYFKLKIHYRLLKTSPLARTLNHTNPLQTLIYNLTLSSHSHLGFIFSVFPTKTLYVFHQSSCLPHPPLNSTPFIRLLHSHLARITNHEAPNCPDSCYFLLSSVQIFSTFCSPAPPVYDMHAYPIVCMFISHITLNKHPKYYVSIHLKIVPTIRTI